MKKLALGSIVMATFIFSGCGSSSSSTAETTDSSVVSEKATGYYVDAAVEGVHYKCGSLEGNTTETGEFSYETHRGCHFSLGDVTLREVNASVLCEHNMTILEDDAKVARMLQSFDTDGNTTNGIQLSDEVTAVLTENNIDEVPSDDAELAALLYELKIKVDRFDGTIVSDEDASEHLEHTRDHLRRNGHRTQYGYLDSNETTDEEETSTEEE